MNKEAKAGPRPAAVTNGGPAGTGYWEAIYSRLEKAGAALARKLAPTAEDQKKILKERAGALARESRANGAPGAQLEVLEFRLAGERYAIEPAYVQEVSLLKDATPLPCTPPFVAGVINLRGRILPVIDLKKLFHLPEEDRPGNGRVIVIHGGGAEFGILADAVPGVRTIPGADLQPPLPTLTGVRAEYLKGVTGEGLAVLDAARILSD
ncbi:MAG: chemotaxis protein CheW, partial [Peptococcaceae bacterium]|nr:chemotaxis protein CheW [Peptococcaceae bacterium]